MIQAFHDVRFPMRLSLGAIGGPERATEILSLASGQEIRNARWTQSRRRWDVGGAVTDLSHLQEIISFFEARMGRLFGFRFRDPLDFSSAEPGESVTFDDQQIGVGDGATTSFQLVKTTGMAARTITKPAPGTVTVGLDGQSIASDWSVDHMSGRVTFATPPADGSTVTAGFEFDCAARFESDQIQAVIESFGAGRVANLGIVELL